ncbi:MAG: hypothetical protein R1F54_01500 [Candidatus Zeuxoniibacter abyssi]|nr:MAG: hypothetical protein R1F54_01500 [Candidatus Persebacteraceae bacterium AB1(2)]
MLPKNSRHRKPGRLKAEAVGDVAAFDSIAYRAYGKRGYAITAIDLYSRIGFAMMFSSKSARSSAQVLRGMEAFLLAPTQTILTTTGRNLRANLPVRRGTKTLFAFILIRIARSKTPSMNASIGRFGNLFWKRTKIG